MPVKPTQKLPSDCVIQVLDYMNSLDRSDVSNMTCLMYVSREMRHLSIDQRMDLIERLESLAELISRGVFRDVVRRVPPDGWSVPEPVLIATCTAPMIKTLNEHQQERWRFNPESFLAHLLKFMEPSGNA